ncbi:MAG: DnaA ATPase domain-containing protein, partial [Neisseriaceae bacterium]
METTVIWQQCLSLLKEQLGDQIYKTWISGLKLKFENGKLQIVANNRLVHDYIKNKYWDKISQVLDVLANGMSSELIVANNAKPSPITQEEEPQNILSGNPVKETHKITTNRLKTKNNPINKEILESLQNATKLNANYTFDSLVRGNSNQLAYAIGLHITQQPGHRNHNPLFIYGGVGLGKTHLMQAIGN